MSKQVAKKQESEVASVDVDAFGGGELSSTDIIIPKVLTMQGLSKLVTEGTAKFGDFVDSISSTVIGNYASGHIEFIPFHLEKSWIISKKMGDRFVYDRVEPWSLANDGKQWEEVINGVVYKNEKAFSFYCILPSDPSIPYIIQFKGTSIKAGKELATQMYVKNRAVGKVPPAKVMKLSGERTQNDKGIFVKLKSAVVRDSKVEEIQTCLEWFSIIKQGNVKVDDESHDGEDASSTSETLEASQF